VFPVVADPWLGVNYIDHTEWADLWEWNPTLMVYPTFWGRVAGPEMGWIVWEEALDKTEREGYPDPDTSTMRNQFYCHYDFVRLRRPMGGELELGHENTGQGIRGVRKEWM